MIIQSISPSRIGLFGGSTDIPEYYQKYGGLVINFAVNIFHKYTMCYGEDLGTVGIGNQVPYGGSKEFIYTIHKAFGLDGMHHTSFKDEYEGIITGGMGASAAAAVGIVAAINKRKNLGMSRLDIAETAWDIEVNKLGLFGGKQDQIAAAFGGFNAISFSSSGIEVNPFDRKYIDRLMPAFLLFHTGKDRVNPKIQEEFKQPTSEQLSALYNLKELALKSIDYIGKGDIERLGLLMDEAWEFKKQSNKYVTNERIDKIYKTAKENGAFGGKIMGAGSGGFFFCIIDPDKRNKLIETLEFDFKGLSHWDFEPCMDGVLTRFLPK